MRTLALPKEVEHWSLTTLREKLVKIGAKVVRHGWYVTFQLAEVAVPRQLFREILSLIDDLRRRPAPAEAGEIDGQEKAAGEVCLDGKNLAKWPSKQRPITKIRPSDGWNWDIVPLAVISGTSSRNLDGIWVMSVSRLASLLERTALGETFALAPDWARARGRALACLLLLLVCACAQGPYAISLMPVPAIYEDGKIDPFAGEDRIDESRHPGIFYATLRAPASDGGPPFYLDQRGDALRLGLARVSLGVEEMTWRDAVEVSLQKDRPTNYALRVLSIEEYGVLSESVTPFTDPTLRSAREAVGDRRFLQSLESELANSRQRDLFIYVHGYKVPFSDPILVAAELWHFLGYEGAFIAFSWPATPSRWAYFADADTAMVSAHGFRKFLQFLARESSARRIHIVGYSAGTRMVALTLHQMALLAQKLNDTEPAVSTKLGHVVLVGSDVDRGLMGVYLVDRLMSVIETLTIYLSESDGALNLLAWLLGDGRTGQMWAEGEMKPVVNEFLLGQNDIHLINVTEAVGAARGNGHGYFRKSPWASSDILALLRYGIHPAERGLIRDEGDPVWHFPPNYPNRVREKLKYLEPSAGPAR